MLSVGNNFFYTKSLHCSLWFFDKGKRAELQDNALFLDARNYYTVVDRTLNEWSEWQLKNLNAIVWLYREQVDKYAELLGAYCEILGRLPFAERASQLTAEIAHRRAEAKQAVDQASKREKKMVQAECDEKIAALDETLTVVKEAVWLYEKFGEGVYRDIPGLCKVASRAEIAEKNYTVTPGAYVGVAAVKDDGVDFAQRMAEIHAELLKLQAESNRVMDTISKNMKEMGV